MKYDDNGTVEKTVISISGTYLSTSFRVIIYVKRSNQNPSKLFIKQSNNNFLHLYYFGVRQNLFTRVFQGTHASPDEED